MSLCIPIVVLVIIFYSYFKKIDVYQGFLEGASEGIKVVFEIAPAILGMVFAINLFVSSGVLEFLLSPFQGIFKSFNLPNEIISIMNSIFNKYGVDSFYGFLASVLQGCTDTTIYVLALYFGSVKISKSRYALKVGLFADFWGIMAAFILCNFLF